MVRASLGVVIFVLAAVTAPAAFGAANQAVVCLDPAAAGAPVQSSCSVEDPTNTQFYRNPSPFDLVRVDPKRKPGERADWSDGNSAFQWKPFYKLAVGELYEVCLTDIPPNTSVASPLCTNWAFIAKVAQPSSGPRAALLVWQAPTKFVNETDIPGSPPIQYRVYRGISETACGAQLQYTEALTMLLDNQPLGKQCYCVSAVWVPTAEESEKTGPSCKTMRIAAPTEGAIEKPSDGSIER